MAEHRGRSQTHHGAAAFLAHVARGDRTRTVPCERAVLLPTPVHSDARANRTSLKSSPGVRRAQTAPRRSAEKALILRETASARLNGDGPDDRSLIERYRAEIARGCFGPDEDPLQTAALRTIWSVLALDRVDLSPARAEWLSYGALIALLEVATGSRGAVVPVQHLLHLCLAQFAAVLITTVWSERLLRVAGFGLPRRWDDQTREDEAREILAKCRYLLQRGGMKNLPWPLDRQRPYLEGAVVNMATRRGLKDGPRVALDERAASLHWQSGAPDERIEAIRDVQRALDTLSPREREAVERCDLEGWKAVELAAALGKSPETIRQRRSRAHRKLRERLEKRDSRAEGGT